MARRYDPGRRHRIIDAAIRVVGRDGIAGLSHRTVAAEADVPLGSTTYHFASLDELLVAALRQSNEGFGATMMDSPVVTDPESDLAAETARIIGRWLTVERAEAERCYELYLAALRRPALRPVAGEWIEDVVAALAHRLDGATARAVAALMDGLCLEALLTGRPYDEEAAREMLARLVAPAGTAGRSAAPAVPDRPAGPAGPAPERVLPGGAASSRETGSPEAGAAG